MKPTTATFLFGLLLGALAASLVFAFAKPGVSSSERSVKALKLAHALPAQHPVHAGMVHFGERLRELSGRRFEVTIFPNGQLGTETQNIEQLQSGTLDFAKASAAPLGNFISVIKVFSLPYLFRDREHYWSVLDSPIGEDLLAAIATNDGGRPSGLHGLTYYDSGSRNFYGIAPIREPADLRGSKIRVMNDPVAMDMVSALGGAPTPIAFGELYTALQQGVVDGAENNPPSFISSRHYEICKHFTFDHHSRIPDVLLMSEDTWSALSPAEQDWVTRAARESSQFQREAWARAVEESIATMTEKGVTIYEADLTPFVENTASVRRKYATGPIADFMKRIGEHP